MSLEFIAGWLGATLVLVAYYMVSSGKAKSDSLAFQTLNIIGAILLVYYTYSCKAYASMAVNFIWVFIGVSSLATFKNIKNDYLTKKLIRRFPMKHLVIILLLAFSSLPVLAAKECKRGFKKIDCSKIMKAKRSHFCWKKSKISNQRIEKICKKAKSKIISKKRFNKKKMNKKAAKKQTVKKVVKKKVKVNKDSEDLD